MGSTPAPPSSPPPPPTHWPSRQSVTPVLRILIRPVGSWDSLDPELSCISLPGRTSFPKSLSQLICFTWEGFGAWFGCQAPSLNHFHLQLAAPVHDGNVHIPCQEEEGQFRQSQTKGQAGQPPCSMPVCRGCSSTGKGTRWTKLYAPELLSGDHFKAAEKCFDKALTVGCGHDPQGACLGNNKCKPGYGRWRGVLLH